MRRVQLLASIFLLCLLFGCGEKDDKSTDTPSADDVGTSAALSVPLPSGAEVDFELDNSDPNFQSAPAGGSAVDLSQTPDYSSQMLGDEDQDGAQVQAPESGGGGSSDGEKAGVPSGAMSPASPSPSQGTPTEENKYPNTGIFLEDD